MKTIVPCKKCHEHPCTCGLSSDDVVKPNCKLNLEPEWWFELIDVMLYFTIGIVIHIACFFARKFRKRGSSEGIASSQRYYNRNISDCVDAEKTLVNKKLGRKVEKYIDTT